MYLCYKKSLAKTNTLAFKAGSLCKTYSNHLLCTAIFLNQMGNLINKHRSETVQQSVIISLQKLVMYLMYSRTQGKVKINCCFFYFFAKTCAAYWDSIVVL